MFRLWLGAIFRLITFFFARQTMQLALCKANHAISEPSSGRSLFSLQGKTMQLALCETNHAISSLQGKPRNQRAIFRLITFFFARQTKQLTLCETNNAISEQSSG